MVKNLPLIVKDGKRAKLRMELLTIMRISSANIAFYLWLNEVSAIFKQYM